MELWVVEIQKTQEMFVIPTTFYSNKMQPKGNTVIEISSRAEKDVITHYEK